MKRALAFSFLLACAGVLLGDSRDSRGSSRDSRPLLQDFVRMTDAGQSDETVLAYAKAHRLELAPEVSTGDLLWLRKSGVGEPVIRYMAAIDVRSSDGGGPEDDADDAGDVREAARYSAADSYSDRDYGDGRGRDYENYADGGYDSYPETYDNDDYDYYPAYGAGYYPYPYFFADYGRFGRFRGRGQGFPGRRGHEIDRGRFGRSRSTRGDFDRSLGGRRRGSVIVDHRGPGRQESWRGYPGQGFRGQRGSVIGRGAPVTRAFPRGGFSQGPRAPRVVGNRGFGRPGFSGGGRSGSFARPGFAGGSHAGGGFSRGPVARSGGGRGSVGGRGRR